MEHAAAFVLGLIATLASLVIAGIVWLEHLGRVALTGIGITGQAQSGLLVVFGLLLVVAALRLFGRIFVVLIVVFLLLWLLHLAVPHRMLLWDPGQGVPA